MEDENIEMSAIDAADEKKAREQLTRDLDRISRDLPILRFFRFDHLPARLEAVSRPFAELAVRLVTLPLSGEVMEIPSNLTFPDPFDAPVSPEWTWCLRAVDPAERATALRKLLEAKDAAVRSVLP